ncbi:MAG: peptide deformylase [Alphaproteobacteria bacterium]|nr:peptide deformylase [Alphaproteobacteria bacterium]
MAVLPIITAPDPRLKVKCEPVAAVEKTIARLMDDMLETMYLAPGIGLAAPQVGVTKRVLVVDVSSKDGPREPIRMANPETVWRSDALTVYEEGCLSLPEQYAEVERPEKIRFRYLDEKGVLQEREAEGLLATCIQHEMDHLDGIIFVDHISALKRRMILRKLAKLKKHQALAAD